MLSSTQSQRIWPRLDAGRVAGGHMERDVGEFRHEAAAPIAAPKGFVPVEDGGHHLGGNAPRDRALRRQGLNDRDVFVDCVLKNRDWIQ
jgi:hypothetical protein